MKRYPCPQLYPVPSEIEQVPIMKRRFLSPVFLHCSLGRSSNGSPFSQYRTLTGGMGFSKNMRSLQLYSGILGAVLNDSTHNNCENISWLSPELIAAARWLQNNNCYLKAYSTLLSRPKLLSSNSGPFPTAEHSQSDHRAPPYLERDIVISASDFPLEVHNEDCHYTRLMAGFVHTCYDSKLPLSFNDRELEPLLFPDLFPNGKGHYHGKTSSISHGDTTPETYGKYIKHRLLCCDARFRLHPYWPSWSYLQLEKLRNHQNTMRLWRQQQCDELYKPPTAAELITRSVYTGERIVDETKTTTLPTFIRTGDSYFHEKLLHVNAMIAEYGLPTLFVTLTMAEGKWTHLREILESTDNGDPLPTNRPLHTTLHFIHRKQELKNYVWAKPENSGWGQLIHFFERVEFQNRGAAHTHCCLWTTESKAVMITNNTIRSDLPDPELEPELYDLVKKHQIHTCSQQHCGGPAPLGQTCKRNFPRQFATSTYYKCDELRYVYKCITEEDRWIVPYHAPTLLIWNAHMNAQYVTSSGLGRYLTKYVVKPEPTHIFNISDGDHYRKHVMGRRLGSMECMFLLLGETICNSSVSVKYLPTEPPASRSHAIRPISTIDDDDDDPYWKDCIEKYFARPHDPVFETLTYPDYFRNYRLVTKVPSRTVAYKDDLNYFAVKRSSPIVVRFRYLKVHDGEPFFYQQLLQSLPCRSEDELLGGCQTYRQHFLRRHPEVESALTAHTITTYAQQQTTISSQFDQIMTTLLDSIRSPTSSRITDIITTQLNALKKVPPILPQLAILQLPDDQYYVFSTITRNLGPMSKRKYPFFFITGSAGTGKSYMVSMLIDWLRKSTRLNYLLMAPTGIASENIGGQTIHSSLRLSQSASGFQSLAAYDKDFKKFLSTIDTLIIDEISMVSASLMTFISNLFAQIHNNNLAFGGINVIIVGDLAQLPPVKGSPVFYSSVWHLFYPLFLRSPKRQEEDDGFYEMLQQIRFGNITEKTWDKLMKKASEYSSTQSLDDLLTTTHIRGYRESAEQINRTICNALPMDTEGFLISEAVDFIQGIRISPDQSQAEFKSKTNFPPTVRLQPGARVMFLNNSLIKEGICNGTIGVVTDVNCEELTVEVAFCVHGAIVHKIVPQQTAYFYASGQRASRTQFPLQNSFGLTVHKTQSLTLPHSSIDLAQLFSPGQGYVAISRCKRWADVQIINLNRDSFITDPEVLEEYNRLEKIAQQPLPIT